MDVALFDFCLPVEQIAQQPAVEREAARLLVLDRSSGAIVAHSTVHALPEFLREGDLLVLNNTKVFPARLLGHRDSTGGAVECLLVRRLDADRWEALMHPGQKLHPSAEVSFTGAGLTLRAKVLEQHFHGRRTIRLWSDDGGDVDRIVDVIGHMPLPPYIHRADDSYDRERYQTVYARTRGSIAAPTAGLHLTTGLLERLSVEGVERAAVTLHVGYGTFKPVRVEQVEDHLVDPEEFNVSPEAASSINAAIGEGRRVVAVGTTTTRALETAGVAGGGRVVAGPGTSDLFIHPGHRFRVVRGLLTNFHLPKSSLLMLVCAFVGREAVLDAYREAVARGYRFYSYGDAMLVL
ncbi:MAG TPA: tRNA preQ1(34) S-adenosylmethionine ribosyltransferase-isomerase QueA [Vicinamibacterales bacterium]